MIRKIHKNIFTPGSVVKFDSVSHPSMREDCGGLTILVTENLSKNAFQGRVVSPSKAFKVGYKATFWTKRYYIQDD